ncbi:SH3 domain-containing protein [Leptospira bandrabouensis]|uniref:SH3 domain-containing protein n=1 Tax=Leptospira bandrabouensis TaxID=2484903 RepID=UPI00223DB812|nr:SH3 domain-containing protein [Leptospira bandrabouensis]MCW7460399.1 SH3 domain-containing protein [Leptospira bandrabouensis]MCW7479375.1 SH3 domain-containing protein [Leptospira bandrabouensis]MCW7487045.1 SH3 domain-containing protein [Leptospira bandrabouensis]
MKKILLILNLLISNLQIVAFDKYIPIAGSEVNVRRDPNINSHVINQLPITTLVKIKPNMKVKDTVNKVNGYWVFIENGFSSKNENKNGWVFDIFLGTPEKFKRPKRWTFREFNATSGDYSLKLKMTEDATYKFIYELCAGANCLPKTECSHKQDKKIIKEGYILCVGRGIIETYRDVVWLKHYGQETNEYLYIKNKKLCMQGMLEEDCD